MKNIFIRKYTCKDRFIKNISKVLKSMMSKLLYQKFLKSQISFSKVYTQTLYSILKRVFMEIKGKGNDLYPAIRKTYSISGY